MTLSLRLNESVFLRSFSLSQTLVNFGFSYFFESMFRIVQLILLNDWLWRNAFCTSAKTTLSLLAPIVVFGLRQMRRQLEKCHHNCKLSDKFRSDQTPESRKTHVLFARIKTNASFHQIYWYCQVFSLSFSMGQTKKRLRLRFNIFYQLIIHDESIQYEKCIRNYNYENFGGLEDIKTM